MVSTETMILLLPDMADIQIHAKSVLMEKKGVISVACHSFEGVPMSEPEERKSRARWYAAITFNNKKVTQSDLRALLHDEIERKPVSKLDNSISKVGVSGAGGSSSSTSNPGGLSSTASDSLTTASANNSDAVKSFSIADDELESSQPATRASHSGANNAGDGGSGIKPRKIGAAAGDSGKVGAEVDSPDSDGEDLVDKLDKWYKGADSDSDDEDGGKPAEYLDEETVKEDRGDSMPVSLFNPMVGVLGPGFKGADLVNDRYHEACILPWQNKGSKTKKYNPFGDEDEVQTGTQQTGWFGSWF